MQPVHPLRGLHDTLVAIESCKGFIPYGTNFRRAQFSWIGLPNIFAEITFADGEPGEVLQC